ncbi:hypothetical protein ACFFU8_09150 [Chromobacterium piscinae]|uniref:hypothetical protein n=1 Tax=Chromobacterium piscinae TaxID=686831 RepID=UPI001E36AD55|nr:hypothetical protein [Chromobacterium piscinae]MCD5327929.1 hypothetical protein [Chromobacterium piscinae]
MNKALLVATLLLTIGLTACEKKEVPNAEPPKIPPVIKSEEGANPWGKALGKSNTTSKLRHKGAAADGQGQ